MNMVNWSQLSNAKQKHYMEIGTDSWIAAKREEEFGENPPVNSTRSVVTPPKKSISSEEIVAQYFDTISEEQKLDILNCLFYLSRDDGNTTASEVLISFFDSSIKNIFALISTDVLDDGQTLEWHYDNTTFWNFKEIDSKRRASSPLPKTITKSHLLNLLQCLINIIWRMNHTLVAPTDPKDGKKYTSDEFEPLFSSAINLYLEIKRRAQEYSKDFVTVTINNSLVSVEEIEKLLSLSGTDRSPLQL